MNQGEGKKTAGELLKILGLIVNMGFVFMALGNTIGINREKTREGCP